MSKINRKFFFDTVRLTLFDGSLSSKQVKGLTLFLDYWEDHHAKKDDRWLAYILATAHHEVDRTFKPIKEYGGKKYFFRMYDIEGDRPWKAKELGNFAPGDGILFHGRGFVQLTGRYNYADWQERLGIDLTSSSSAADRVLDPNIATKVLFEGMILGTFTKKPLSKYFKGVLEDWRGARKTVNGLDKANTISSFGRKYYQAISYTTA